MPAQVLGSLFPVERDFQISNAEQLLLGLFSSVSHMTAAQSLAPLQPLIFSFCLRKTDNLA